MFSRAVRLFTLVSAASITPTVMAQDPLFYPGYMPSHIPCVPPACAAPACAAPAYSNGAGYAPTYAATGRTCGRCGHCSHCNKTKGNKGITIDLSRTVIKKNSWGAFGEEPPAGFAVSSMPVLNVSATAIPINFGPAAGQMDAAAFAAAVSQKLREQNAPAAAAASDKQTCQDPCGDIKQLQTEVQQLKEITVNLTNVVAKLVDQKTQ